MEVILKCVRLGDFWDVCPYVGSVMKSKPLFVVFVGDFVAVDR